MKIDMAFLPAEKMDYKAKTVIVIDVLRASSTIVTAFAHGCKSVRTVGSIDDARRLKNENPDILLCGERQGQKIAGFDLGNSPFEYSRKRVIERELVLTTTNGTQAVEAARKADAVFIGCFLNLDAVANLALQYKKDLTLLCSGSDGRFSLEDAFCAGLMLKRIVEIHASAQLEDAAYWTLKALGEMIATTAKMSTPLITDIISETRHGKRLRSLGFYEDIAYCAQLNSLPVVPELAGGKFII